MGAEVRARGTFSAKNPFMNKAKNLVKKMAGKIQLSTNAMLIPKKKRNFRGER